MNRAHIAFNAKHGEVVLPVYTVKTGGGAARYGYAVEIGGPSRLVDPRESRQLSCGARAWIETDSEVSLRDEMTWAEVGETKAEYIRKHL